MVHIIRAALITLPLLLCGPAGHAKDAGLMLRTVEGVAIDISEQSHAEPTVLLTFSTHDPTATSTLRRAQKALRKQGVRMVAVNVDGAQERSALKAWIARSRLKAPVFADPDSQLQSYLATSGPTTLLVGPTGSVVERWAGWDKDIETRAVAAAQSLPAPEMMEMAEKTPLVEADDWQPPSDTLDPANEAEAEGESAGGPEGATPDDAPSEDAD